MTSLTLSVTGMHCDHCPKKVEKALRDVDGVYGASVDRHAGTADVDFDELSTSADALIAAVQSAGYDAAVAG
jgi:copper chaperone CopZ